MFRVVVACVLPLVAAFSSTIAQAADIFVDADAGGANDGSSWGDAFRKLRPALTAATDGDTVRIAQGIYAPANPGGSRNATFLIPDGVRVIGGYAGDGEVDPDDFDPENYVTILTGDLNGDDGADFANDDENSFHVVTVRQTNPGTLLRGVTVRDGRGDQGDVGGGVLCENAVLVLRECIIEENRAQSRGGGVGTIDHPVSSKIHLFDCIVRGNRLLASTGLGGGVSAGPGSTFTRCVFKDNVVPVAGSGGAMIVSGATITACDFIDNSAAEDGGALVGNDVTIVDSTFTGNASTIWGGAALLNGLNVLRNCFFADNRADLGGAIRFNSSTSPGSSLTVIECDFLDNLARLLGGAIYSNGGPLRLVNSDFLGNVADADPGLGLGAGGAVYSIGPMNVVNTLFSGNQTHRSGSAVAAGGPATIINCTLVGNQSASGGGAVVAGGILNLHNSILWDNSGVSPSIEDQQLLGDGNAVFRVRNSTIQGWTGDLGGSHNNGADPLLVDGDGADDAFGTLDDDPRLGVASPARNSGRNDLLPRDDFDLDDDGNVTERISEDLDGDRRIRQGVVDRGAFESTP